MVNIDRNRSTHRLKVEGEMTIVNAIEMKNALLDGLKDCSEVEVDLSNVSDFDTAGLQLLLLLKLTAQKLKKGFRIVAQSESTMRAIKLFQMEEEL